MGLVQKMSTQQLVLSLVEFPWKARWQLVVLELLQEMSYSFGNELSFQKDSITSNKHFVLRWDVKVVPFCFLWIPHK